MTGEVEDNDGKPIEVGDEVWTKFRGGKREGKVEKIVMDHNGRSGKGKKSTQEVQQVIFTGQRGHKVVHNPGTLEVQFEILPFEFDDPVYITLLTLHVLAASSLASMSRDR